MTTRCWITFSVDCLRPASPEGKCGVPVLWVPAVSSGAWVSQGGGGILSAPQVPAVRGTAAPWRLGWQASLSVLWSCCFWVQRVKTETQTKNVKFYSAPRAPKGWAEVLQFHHKHLQGLHALAGLNLQIAQPLQTQNAAGFQGSRTGEVLGGPGKDSFNLGSSSCCTQAPL